MGTCSCGQQTPPQVTSTHVWNSVTSTQNPSLLITRGQRSVRRRDSLHLTLSLASYVPSHTLTFTPAPCFTLHLSPWHCLILTLHLWLANSQLISCHLPTELSVSHFFHILQDLTFRSGRKNETCSAQLCFSGIQQRCCFFFQNWCVRFYNKLQFFTK